MDTVVFDLDGTLCDTRHRAHLVDRSREGGPDWRTYSLACDGDSVVVGTAELLLRLSIESNVVIVSGRDEAARDKTEAWLRTNDLPWDELVMRTRGDFRDNVTLKLEAVERIKAEGHRIILAVDDYPAVVEALLAQGVPALLVARHGWGS